jgi:hypothetical protein
MFLSFSVAAYHRIGDVDLSRRTGFVFSMRSSRLPRPEELRDHQQQQRQANAAGALRAAPIH